MWFVSSSIELFGLMRLGGLVLNDKLLQMRLAVETALLFIVFDPTTS
jgi:hypothetical protein